MTEQSLRDPTWNWPVEWLNRLVGELRQANKWPSEPVMFTNADPAAAIAPNSQFTWWIALRSMTDSVNAPDHRWIDIHSLFPIYAEEAEYARGHGAEALVERLKERGVPLHIDPGRKSVC